MVSAFRDKLSDVQRAPKRGSRTSLAGTKSLIHNAAPVVIRECLTGNPKGFTARRVFDQVPAFGASYTDANALGTALGDGVRGKGSACTGMKLASSDAAVTMPLSPPLNSPMKNSWRWRARWGIRLVML